MTQQHPTPTAADFFGQPTEDEEVGETVNVGGIAFTRIGSDPFGGTLDEQIEAWKAAPGTLHVIPLSPIESIADSLSRLADHFDGAHKRRNVVHQAVGESAADIDYAGAAEQAQLALEEAQDTNEKLRELNEVLDRIQEALGKSTAKPALAAKAVIEEYRNPQVPDAEITGTEGLDHALETYPTGGPLTANEVLPGVDQSMLPGHTRAEVEEGAPDICQECSYAAQDYVVWPCPEIQQAFKPVEPEAPVVASVLATVRPPANDAPVEEWREYARSQGMAGPHIDKANRSQIRTALGIAQPVTPQAGA